MTTEAQPTHPFTPAMKEDPYPKYDEWREQAPVVWSPEINAWLVTTYEVAKDILGDHRTFSSGNSVFGGPLVEHPEFPSMINRDEPDHRRLRGLVAKAFTPRTIDEAWEPRIKEYIDELMDDAIARGDGKFDVVGDLAYPLPVKMIAEIIGVPPELFGTFKAWSNDIVQNIGRVPEHGYETLEEAQSRAEEERAAAEEEGPDEESLFFYFFQQVEAVRENPRDDLLSRLVHAEIDGEQLDQGELIAFLVLLLVAGNETTTNLINHAVRGLAMNQEEQQKLREHPELMDSMIEEALRWESPIQGFYRRAVEDVEVAGTQVKAGDALLVLYAAANRDPAKYECPADFEIDRFDVEEGTRDHLAFGYGVHHCLGANLARIEASNALRAMLDRFESFEPADEPVEWWDTPFFRGPKSYVVNVTYK
jgi:cytochrome P450